MINIKENLKYTSDHDWLSFNKNIVNIGITEFIISMFGQIIYIELPKIGLNIKKNITTVVVIESMKTAYDILAPISGEITSINISLINNPSILNKDPYQIGWLYNLKLNSVFQEDNNYYNYNTYINMIK